MKGYTSCPVGYPCSIANMAHSAHCGSAGHLTLDRREVSWSAPQKSKKEARPSELGRPRHPADALLQVLAAARRASGRTPARRTASRTTAATAASSTSASTIAAAAPTRYSTIVTRAGGLRRRCTAINLRGIRRRAAIVRRRNGVAWSRIARSRIGRVTVARGWRIRSRAICRSSTATIGSGITIAIISIRPLVHDWFVHIQRGPAGWRSGSAIRASTRASRPRRKTLPAGRLTRVTVRGLARHRSVVANFRLRVSTNLRLGSGQLAAVTRASSAKALPA